MPRQFDITDEDREHAEGIYPEGSDGGYMAALGLSDLPEASDGCTIYEPDGECQHGRPSPLIVLGLI